MTRRQWRRHRVAYNRIRRTIQTLVGRWIKWDSWAEEVRKVQRGEGAVSLKWGTIRYHTANERRRWREG